MTRRLIDPFAHRHPPDRRQPAERDPGRAAAPNASRDDDVLSVSELAARLRRAVERVSTRIRVAGEVAGLRQVASGHTYFSLQDERAQASVDCVLYRSASARARRLLVEGASVIAIGRATVFEPRGRLQFIVDSAEPAGQGRLLLALEERKQKLAAEGLFAADRKRPLPRDPRTIGVVTSLDGAAIADIRTVAFRRGGAHLLVAPAPVQGPQAALMLAKSVRSLARVAGVDLIIVSRGGGSLEDLMPFNDEALVRTIAACAVPVVSGVGHEIDTTLVDLVADVRAATPSQAAELAIVDQHHRAEVVARSRERLRRGLGEILARRDKQQRDLAHRLDRSVRAAVRARRLAVADRERALAARHPSTVLTAARKRLTDHQARLGPSIARRLGRERMAVETLDGELAQSLVTRLAEERARLSRAAATLSALSPLDVLGRGYAIAFDAEGRAVRHREQLEEGDETTVRVQEGSFRARVLSWESPTAEQDPGLGVRGEDDGDEA